MSSGDPAERVAASAAGATSLRAPDVARIVFGDRVGMAERYARLLVSDGIVRGLLGPREVPRLWERHLLNCAALSELLPTGARVVDVGSGAGLPGIVLAIRRPDLRLDLVEPMARRTEFLAEALAELGIGDRVRVIRGRAEDPATIGAAGLAEWITARAVAPLDRLVKMCLPLLVPHGRLLAVKGSGADRELSEHRIVIGQLGGSCAEVLRLGAGLPTEPTIVVSIQRAGRRQRRKNPK